MENEINVHRAVRRNDTDTVKRLMSSGNFFRMKEWSHDNGYNLLALSIAYRSKEMAKLLLEHGAKIYPRTNLYPNTLLHNAVISGDIELVKMLLDRGSSVDDTNGQHMTPLNCAASRAGQVQIMEFLLKNGASVTARCGRGKMPLHWATETGHLQNVECLLNHGAPVNGVTCKVNFTRYRQSKAIVKRVRDSCEYTPLHYACELDNEKLVTLLLSRGADVNAIADNKSTPLHVAAERKQEKNVRLLLDHGGADINARANNGETILDVAIRMMDSVTLAHILKSRPDMNRKKRMNVIRKALFQSTSEDSIKIVDTLVEFGFTVCAEDANNSNLLHNAVEKGCLKIVEDLLRYGSDVNQTLSDDFKGGTPLLHVAVSNDYIEIAELLIKHDVDVHANNVYGRTPIFTAIRVMNTSMIKLLLSRRANVNDCDPSGLTPLHYLVLSMNHISEPEPNEYTLKYLRRIRNENFTVKDRTKNIGKRDFIWVDIAKLILDGGASVDARTGNGFTALQFASAGKHATIVKVLLEYNADVNHVAAQDSNKTSLHYSTAAGCKTISKMLVESGANINVKDIRGRTPLHVACRYYRTNIVKVLLKYGADVDSKDNKDRTPLHIAVTKGSSKIVKILLHQGTCELGSRNKYGITALNSALILKWDAIVEDILNYSSDIMPGDFYELSINIHKFSELWTDYPNIYPEYNSEADHGYSQRPLYRSLNIHKSRDDSDDDDEEYDYHELSWILSSDHQHIYNIVKMQMLKINALNNFPTELILEIFGFDGTYITFQRDCEQEIEKLKSTKIAGSYVSFHDVLTKSMRHLSSWVKNEIIREALELTDYKNMFRLYSCMIYMRFKRALYRNRLLNQSSYYLNSFTGVEIPDLPSMELLSYLSDKDLINLIKACAQSEG